MLQHLAAPAGYRAMYCWCAVGCSKECTLRRYSQGGAGRQKTVCACCDTGRNTVDAVLCWLLAGTFAPSPCCVPAPVGLRPSMALCNQTDALARSLCVLARYSCCISHAWLWLRLALVALGGHRRWHLAAEDQVGRKTCIIPSPSLVWAHPRH